MNVELGSLIFVIDERPKSSKVLEIPWLWDPHELMTLSGQGLSALHLSPMSAVIPRVSEVYRSKAGESSRSANSLKTPNGSGLFHLMHGVIQSERRFR